MLYGRVGLADGSCACRSGYGTAIRVFLLASYTVYFSVDDSVLQASQRVPFLV